MNKFMLKIVMFINYLDLCVPAEFYMHRGHQHQRQPAPKPSEKNRRKIHKVNLVLICSEKKNLVQTIKNYYF